MSTRLILAATALLVLVVSALAVGPAEKARELRSSDLWINTEGPIKLSSLRGRVVLIDFWAFDCAPCIEAMPHIQALHEKYAKDGLVVIGVHTPRTENEKELTNLRAAAKRMGIRFPIVMDVKQKIWSDYRCDLWPTQFVIDRQGFIRFSHGGVGRYADIEHAVQAALSEK